MGFLKDLGGKILDQELGDIFGSSSFTLADIAEAVRQEVAKVFFQQEANDALIDAAASLKTAQDFLRIDYLIAKNSGLTDAELWKKLDDSTATPNLANLETAANTLEGWINAASQQDGNDRIAATATTLYLGMYLHICLYYRERSLVAPADQKTAERLTMQARAHAAITTMMPHALGLIDDRLGCLQYQLGDFPHGVPEDLVGDSLTDHWFDGAGQNVVYAWNSADDGAEYTFALRAVMHATSRLLSNGGQAQADALWSALESKWLNKAPTMDTDVRSDYRGLTYTEDWNFGKWAIDARNLLMQLDIVATGIGGSEQDQWSYCSTCGVLYFSDGPSTCPGRNAFGTTSHMSPASSNYVMHCDSPSPPSGTQADWRWCANCGVLHLASGGASVCPAGGAHVSAGSANYLIPIVPPAPPVGLATLQDGWNWCKNCGALHFGGGGASICPAAAGPIPGEGGPHATAAESASGSYQLASLGNALWEPPF